jgi:hypothetical protein
MGNVIALHCNRCHRPMTGSTAYDGACQCGGLIELDRLRSVYECPICGGTFQSVFELSRRPLSVWCSKECMEVGVRKIAGR